MLSVFSPRNFSWFAGPIAANGVDHDNVAVRVAVSKKLPSDCFDVCSFEHPFHSAKIFTPALRSPEYTSSTNCPLLPDHLTSGSPRQPCQHVVLSSLSPPDLVRFLHGRRHCTLAFISSDAILVPTTYGFFVACTLPARPHLAPRPPALDTLLVVAAAWIRRDFAVAITVVMMPHVSCCDCADPALC